MQEEENVEGMSMNIIMNSSKMKKVKKKTRYVLCIKMFNCSNENKRAQTFTLTQNQKKN